MTNLKGSETNLNDSIIVLDTNVISDIFEASPDYYNFIINCLDKVKDNVYLTDTIFHELSSIKGYKLILVKNYAKLKNLKNMKML